MAVLTNRLGQPRQAELVEHLLTNVSDSRIKEISERLMIDLSPICYGGVGPVSPWKGLEDIQDVEEGES